MAVNKFEGLLQEIMTYLKEKENFEALIRNVYKGKVLGHSMFEYMEPGRYYLYMTNPEGGRPFANRTNDKVDDNEFPRGILSTVPLELNYRIVAVKKEQNDSYTMQVHRVSYTDPERLELEQVFAGTTLGLYEPFLIRSVGEAIDKLNMKPIMHWEQQINKHAFNPVRTIETHLMINLNPNESSILQGYNKEGKQIELSNKTKDTMIQDSEEISIAGIYRIFYYKKFDNDGVRFVSGIQLRHLTIHDINEYLPHCEVGKDSIVNVNLINGAEMLGLAIGQNVHLIYEHVTGYKSIRLSPNELKYVESIDPISVTQ